VKIDDASKINFGGRLILTNLLFRKQGFSSRFVCCRSVPVIFPFCVQDHPSKKKVIHHDNTQSGDARAIGP